MPEKADKKTYHEKEANIRELLRKIQFPEASVEKKKTAASEPLYIIRYE